MEADIEFTPNPRYHGDGVQVYFGSSQDSRVFYDGTNDEWTIQTKDSGGTQTDRVKVVANGDLTTLELYNDDPGASGIRQDIYHESASPAAGDDLLALRVYGDDDGGNKTQYGQSLWEIVTVTDTAEDGRWSLSLMKAGTLTEMVRVDETGILFVGDTLNAGMTQGITINQGAEIDEVFAVKSSDITHGVTTVAETDTFGLANKQHPTKGGLGIKGFSENERALVLEGIATGEDTTKTYGSGNAGVILKAWKANGTGTAVLGADGNMVAFHDGAGGVRFIFDIEGSGHADVEWVAFDKYDDVGMMKSFQNLLTGFGHSMVYNREALEEVGIIGRNSMHEENGKLRGMVNFTKLSMLHHGAIQQVYAKLEDAVRQVDVLENRLLALEAA